jgi:hypothetical protein
MENKVAESNDKNEETFAPTSGEAPAGFTAV